MTIYEYDLQGRETYEGDGTYPIRFTYYDEGRMTGMTTYRDESEPGDTTAWTHDPATGLLIQKLYDDGKGPSYSYLSGSSLVSGMTASTGHAWSRSYEPHRNLLSFVENKYGSVIISRFDYENDEIGRRTAISRSGTAFDIPVQDAYGYNTRSEVTSARRTLADTPSQEVRGFSYDYAYDPIGNRTSATEYDHEDNALVESYTANALNQYTQRTVPGHAGVRGSATNTATVTVNGNATWRLGEYFYGGDEADNANAAVMKELETLAVVNPPGTNMPDIVQAVAGRVFVAQSPEAFTHDDDGNLTQDGRFVYTWDGENRLVSVETRSDLPASVPRVKVTYAYDHQSRRIGKEVSHYENNAWIVAEFRSFLYNRWNMIRETIDNQQSAITNSLVWGLDLSGSLQGAGGVGGLLSTTKDSATYYPAWDGNGNITDYTDSSGAIAAHYEYSLFGETVTQSGSLADTFPFRFSTKYWEDEAKLCYYGYRFYSPNLGRWLSRDPIEEDGGMNMFVFVRNDLLDNVDWLGMRKACDAAGFSTPAKYNKCSPCNKGDVKGTWQRKSYNNESNGCGPFAPIFGVIPGGWVPDNPMGRPGCSFSTACDYHDCCYGWCGTTQAECDAGFLASMKATCRGCISIGILFFSPQMYLQELAKCYSLAELYAWAVRQGGDGAHASGQSDACEECCCN